MAKKTAPGCNSDIALSDHDQHTHGLHILAKIMARHHANRSPQVNKYTIHDTDSRGGKDEKKA